MLPILVASEYNLDSNCYFSKHRFLRSGEDQLPFTYRPFFKTKAGEAVALGQLSHAQKDRVFPVFQLGETLPGTFHQRVVERWGPRPLALDGTFNFNFTGSIAAFDHLFGALAGSGIPVIPSLSIGAPIPYLNAVLPKVNVAGPGVLLRSDLGNLPNASQYAQQQGWPTGTVDLVVEVGHIAEFNPATFAGYVNAVIGANVGVGTWRSVSLSGASAPKDFGGMPQGVNIIPRQEWALWNNIQQIQNRPIDFSDYGVSHLDLSEPPGFAMARATVSVRYTCPNYWIMLKGYATKGPRGIPMSTQYSAHATQLTQRPEFNGVHPCWGDDRISAIARGASPGGRSQWVEINTNRHLSLVTQSLP
ncbi:beta family protein [Shinella sp.]|uniref:beta family protein n=1 Tax=Shinella sp. TaxID=1870904 RepID=UPI003F6FAAB6